MEKFILLRRKFSKFALVLLVSFYISYAHSAVLYFDNFESSLGNWSNVSSGDNNNWTRDFGGTSSYDTGPATGASGSLYYMYLETSSGYAYTAGDSAILLGPTINDSYIHLNFSYHMYGSDMGTLAVDILSNGSWIENVWSISGQQHNSHSAAYTSIDVDLSTYSVSQIRFRAVAAGNYHGDMAIDNISIESIPVGPAPPSFINDPFSKPDALQDQLYGDSIAADATDPNGDTLSFRKISGPVWLDIALDGTLSGTPNSNDLGVNNFIVEASDGSLTTNATLSINVTNEIILPVISNSDFESPLSDWYNITQDDDDWRRHTGATASTETGPSGGADGSNYYMYVETSSGSAYDAGDTAILESKQLENTSNIHLKLQYHMYGSNIGTLSVDVFDNANWTYNVWSITGQQHTSNTAAYTSVEIDLSAYSITQLRIRVTAAGSYQGDIAVDNIEILGNGTISSTPAKIAFVTSQGYNGDLGGLAGADAICQAEANAAGLPGTFKAFLSDNNTAAADRLTHSSMPYALIDGTQIANDWDDLVDGSISSPLNVTVTGGTVSGYAWTGSDSDGTKATYYASDYPSGYFLDLTCNNWTMSTSSLHYLGARGNVNDANAWIDWWQNDGSSCTSVLALYCFAQ